MTCNKTVLSFNVLRETEHCVTPKFNTNTKFMSTPKIETSFTAGLLKQFYILETAYNAYVLKTQKRRPFLKIY